MGKRYKAETRERLVEQVLATKAPVKVVAERLGVKESTAYFWMRKAHTTPAFARLIPTSRGGRVASLAIEMGGAVIRVEPGFDAELLLQVVSALSRVAS